MQRAGVCLRNLLIGYKVATIFTNTLADRIVTGHPKDEVEAFAESLGYRDNLFVAGEIFHFFAIEVEQKVATEINETLPFQKAGLNVVLTDDATPYKHYQCHL